jgi:hypothetical protein
MAHVRGRLGDLSKQQRKIHMRAIDLAGELGLVAPLGSCFSCIIGSGEVATPRTSASGGAGGKSEATGEARAEGGTRGTDTGGALPQRARVVRAERARVAPRKPARADPRKRGRVAPREHPRAGPPELRPGESSEPRAVPPALPQVVQAAGARAAPREGRPGVPRPTARPEPPAALAAIRWEILRFPAPGVARRSRPSRAAQTPRTR